MALLACVAVLLVVLVLWLRTRVRNRALQSDLAALGAERDCLLSALAAPADGCVVWGPDGEICVQNLPGEDAGETPQEALVALFVHADGAAANAAITALRHDGTAFDLELDGAQDSRRWRLTGTPIAGAPGGQVVQLHDVTARTQALRDSRTRQAEAEARLDDLQALLDAVPVALYRRRPDLSIGWCNQAYADLVGLSRDAVPGSAEAEIESAMNRNAGQQMAQAARDAGETRMELRHFVVDGARRALEVVEVPGLPGGDGGGLVRDLTDLEDKEGELRRHMDAHAEVLNNLSTSIAIFGPDKRLNYFNQAYADLWRLDSEWLSTWPLHTEVLDALREGRRLPEVPDFPAYKAARMARYTDLLETLEEIDYLPDNRILRRVTSPHPFGGLCLLDEDITDKMALERSFNTMIAVQRETLGNLYEGVAVFGSDGCLKLFNPAFARIWHLDPEHLAGEPHVADVVEMTRDLFEDRGDWPALKEHLIGQATDRQNIAGRMERPDDNVIDYASVALPDGNMLFTYVDVTDTVNVERALRERNMALETADRLKSEFLASVSYELRTPLNVIIGFAEVLVNEYFGKLNARQREYGQDILNSSQQLLALINDILDLASIEAGRLELEPGTFDVRLMLENVLMLARERAQRRKLQLRIDCPEDVGAMVGDEKRLKQALFNLVSNSLKYTEAGGEIVLQAARDGDAVALTVSDNGVGIHEDDQELVFDSFQQGRRGNAEHSAGLGLSLVKRFTELHHGHIELDSEVGEGTRISIVLPAPPGADQQEPQRLAAADSD